MKSIRCVRHFRGTTFWAVWSYSTGRIWTGENSTVVLFALEFISRLVLQISELLECLSGRDEQTSECLPLMTGNRLKGIRVKICGMFCSTGVWDIPVFATTNKPKMEIVEKVLLMVQLVLRKSWVSYFHKLFQQSPTTNTEQETTKSNFKISLYKAPCRVWNTSVNNSI